VAIHRAFDAANGRHFRFLIFDFGLGRSPGNRSARWSQPEAKRRGAATTTGRERAMRAQSSSDGRGRTSAATGAALSSSCAAGLFHPEPRCRTPGFSPRYQRASSGARHSWEREYRDLEGSIKLRNYSRKTFAAYGRWVGKFQGFARSRPSSELGSDEVKGFLSELGVGHGVAASTSSFS
jgi:hypothetical protein